MSNYQPEPGHNIESTDSKEQYNNVLKTLDFRREELRFAWGKVLRDGLGYASLDNVMETRDKYRECVSDFLRVWNNEYNDSIFPYSPSFETKQYEFLLVLHRETQARRDKEYGVIQPKLLQHKAGNAVIRPWLTPDRRSDALDTLPSRHDFIYDHHTVNRYWGFETMPLQRQQASFYPPSVDVMDHGLITAAESTTRHLMADEYTLLDVVCSKSSS